MSRGALAAAVALALALLAGWAVLLAVAIPHP